MPKLAIVDDIIVTRDVWDRLVQSLIFFGDRVTLRASYVPSANIDGVRLARLLAELREMDLVRFWAHEYEVDDRLRLRVGEGRHQIDLVASPTFLRESMQEIDENLRRNRANAYERSAKQQGIGEIIAFRHMLTSSMVSSAIDSNGLMMSRSTQANTPFGLPETFSEAVTRSVRQTLTIPPLDLLTAEQILACRPYSEGFRLLLEKEIGATAASTGGTLSAADVAGRLLNTRHDVSMHLHETMRPSSTRTWRVQSGTLVSTFGDVKHDGARTRHPTETAVAAPAHGILLLNQLVAHRVRGAQ